MLSHEEVEGLHACDHVAVRAPTVPSQSECPLRLRGGFPRECPGSLCAKSCFCNLPTLPYLYAKSCCPITLCHAVITLCLNHGQAVAVMFSFNYSYCTSCNPCFALRKRDHRPSTGVDYHVTNQVMSAVLMHCVVRQKTLFRMWLAILYQCLRDANYVPSSSQSINKYVCNVLLGC